jgi:hypothetical protein
LKTIFITVNGTNIVKTSISLIDNKHLHSSKIRIADLRTHFMPISLTLNGKHTSKNVNFSSQYNQLPLQFRTNIEESIDKQTILKHSTQINLLHKTS